jgi:uncharacterized protein YbjQ (UPF0145 family)
MNLPIPSSCISTTDQLPGYRVTQSLGVSEGVAITNWTGFLPDAQRNALKRVISDAFVEMIHVAASHGANAILGLRYTMPSGEDERIVIAYGTAVKVEKNS